MHRDFSEVNSRGEVLIVEDTAASLKLLSDLLSGAGYAVRQAPNGELALWTAQARAPDLILLDVRMPGLDGFEVCRRLKETPSLCEVPVIFLSAQHDTDDKVRGFALGAVDFIAKPFQAEEILARTDAHVRLRRAQLQLAQERATLEQRVTERTAELEQVAGTLAREVQIRRANEDLLRLSGQVFEATQDAILITDASCHIVASNPAFTRVTGYAAQEVLGLDITRLYAEATGEAVCEALRQGLHSSGYWTGEVQTRRKSGDAYPCLLSATVVRGPDGAVINYIGVFLDISERKAEQHLIDFLSYHDALTGLPNRTLVRERFEPMRAQALRESQQVVLMCLDLDRFKNINDSHGQAVGDKALQVVSRFLTSCVREGDIVARQGGDEFQILLQDDALLGRTLALAQTILGGLREELSVSGDRLALTTSIGIAMCPADGESLDDLLRHADTALVRAKEMGRDHYAFFTERMGSDIRDRLAVQQQLRGAVGRDEFEVHYQPQVCLRTGAMVGAEALLRWDNPVLGRVPPGVFITLAEEYGFITAIGEWVLESVCAQIRTWQDAGLGNIKVAVNLSGKQFAQDRTVPFVEAALRRYAIAPACLGIEITESAVMGDPDKAVAALTRLKDIGVSISLDDFGTGYSSLGYLKRFPIDVLKIDKSFVDDVCASRSDAAIARSVISLAHNLHMRVIAEGVETREQLDFLRGHDCDEMQGYYFSRPLTAQAFTALLHEKRTLDIGAA